MLNALILLRNKTIKMDNKYRDNRDIGIGSGPTTTYTNGPPHMPTGRSSNGYTNPSFTGSPNDLDNLGYTEFNINTTDLNDLSDTNRISNKWENTDTSNQESDEFRSLVPFCIVFGLGSLLSQSVSVYLSSQITVLERAYGLSSTKSGLLLSANDVGFVITVLMASHFLKNNHIPRILALCVFTFGVSGVLTSLPHFVFEKEEGDHSYASTWNSTHSVNTQLCNPGHSSNLTTAEKCAQEEKNAQSGNQWVMIFIAAMMFIQGVAKAPRSPLSTVYVDNNSQKVKTGFYIGILMSFSIFGPFIAITAGGLFNKMPVDLKETTMTPEDPRWIGAWWLGFIVFGAGAILTSFPIFFFPSSLRVVKDQPTEYANSTVAETVVESRPSFKHTIKDMPRSVFRVLGEPVYSFNMVAVLCQMFALLAFGSFGPKYIENQFQISTWKANIVMGIEKLVTTVVGTIAGGIITRRFRLGLVGCVKMILISRCIVFLCQCFNFLLGCDNPDIVGFDAERQHMSRHAVGSQMSTGMSIFCECNDATYLPVCGGGMTYFSPCHAGCESESNGMYYNCTLSGTESVQLGMCDTGCSFLLPYVLMNALSSLVGTLTLSPTYVAVLRCVKERDRSMAVGLMSFLMSLLVFLPAPIVYGEIFDSFCLVWKSSCNQSGSCSLYDSTVMRHTLVAINVGLIVTGVLLTCVTFYFARRKAKKASKTPMETLEIKPPVAQPRTSLGKT